jgi:hypothetical protein
MNNYKCSQCGLTNWINQQTCKRCQSANPYLSASAQPTNATNMNQPSQFSSAMPDFNQPPPPNVFGNQAGVVNNNQFHGVAQNNPQMQNYGYSTLSQEDAENLKTAEKQIKNAWISGAIVCGITVIFALIFSKMTASQNSMPASPIEMILTAVILGGLTVGVYFKSRACAILLCGLFVLDKIIGWASTGKMSGAILAFVFIYYFIYGIQGTFTYQKLIKKQR